METLHLAGWEQVQEILSAILNLHCPQQLSPLTRLVPLLKLNRTRVGDREWSLSAADSRTGLAKGIAPLQRRKSVVVQAHGWSLPGG